MEQRTEEWFDARMGCVTASRTADVMAKTKSGYAASRANYMADLICERLTQERSGGFSSAAMQWGTETEPMARAAYEFVKSVDVEETGFVLHPHIKNFGASPDGLVGKDGLVEIKCPNTNTHLETILTDTIPRKYIIQMHVQMICTKRKWCDFVSFDPRLPLDLQIYVKRVELDNNLAMEIEDEVNLFLDELDAKVADLKKWTRNNGQ